MSDWWETPYKGGPMVPVPGFPRPVYPPDAAEKGKTPSSNGPDVEAYKRTVSRAGRWKWQSFDRQYSNGFAHGKGPNVIDTGVAGVQRQQGIDPTGWIGKGTFDILRSIRVPEGPHAGEMAMDAYSQSLLVLAWEQFGGTEPTPDPPPEAALRTKALARAVGEIGVKESPPNSNRTPYTVWYGMTGPWCAMFCTWAYEQAGNSPSFRRGETYAYVPYIVSDSRNNRNGLAVTTDPVAGDLVCFDWQGDGVFDHVGLFERWDNRSGGRFISVEGNTSSDVHGDQSNGGEVCRKTRSLGGVVFARVREP